MITEKTNNIIFHIEGGIGKNILATGVVGSIKKTYPDKNIIVVTAWDEPWISNPNVYRVYNFNNLSYFYDDYIKGKSETTSVIRHDPYHSEDYILRKKHIIDVWCDLAGVKNTESPKIYLSQREIDLVSNTIGNDTRPIFLIHPNGGADVQGGLPYSWARDLPPNLTQEIINRMNNNGFRTIQIRRQNQLEFKGAETYSSTIRLMMALLPLTTKRLLIDSFVQHACMGLNLKSVVCWIANKPEQIGYNFHTNIVVDKPMRLDATRTSYLEAFNIMGSLPEYPYPQGELFDIDEIEKKIMMK